MSNIQLFDSPQIKSIQQCIDEAYASFNVPNLGGASVDGWSKISDFQRCPYRYWALHEQIKCKICDGTGLISTKKIICTACHATGKITDDVNALVQIGSAPAALEIGSLFHALLACHYIGSVKGNTYPEYPTALELLERMRSFNANEAILQECQRLYFAYFNHYGNPQDEGFEPVAIELGAGIPNVHTCRFDMLAKRDGLWIVEHKTASRESRDVLESWWLDGEIIGEVYGYRLSKLEEKYGPLVGVLVNITIKTQVPKFRRVEVVIPDSLLERYALDREHWANDRKRMRTANHWPRKLQGCINRYDTCAFWDHCRDAAATDGDRMMSLLQQSIGKNKGE